MEHAVIRQFFYVSRSLAAPGDLKRILASARLHNEQRCVTGALLFTGGHFAQLLEGAEGALAQTIEIIQADTRHVDMKCVLDGATTTPRCTGWSMAFMETPGADELIEGLLAQRDAIAPERGQRLLRLMFEALPGKED